MTIEDRELVERAFFHWQKDWILQMLYITLVIINVKA